MLKILILWLNFLLVWIFPYQFSQISSQFPFLFWFYSNILALNTLLSYILSSKIKLLYRIIWNHFILYIIFILYAIFFKMTIAAIPNKAPQLSIITSLNWHARPGTKYWCISSEIAYNTEIKSAIKKSSLDSLSKILKFSKQSPPKIAYAKKCALFLTINCSPSTIPFCVVLSIDLNCSKKYLRYYK